MAKIRLHLLGGLEIIDSSGQSIKLSVKKAKALLVYLAVQPHTRFSRNQLARILWPKATGNRARQSLRQAIADLRKHLPNFDKFVDISHNHLQANEENLCVDWLNFEQLAKRSDPRAHDEAYGYYRGRFLDGFSIRSESFSAWCEEINQTAHDLSIHIIESLSEHQLLEGNISRAIELCQHLIKLDPVRESAHRNLMSLFAKQGDTNAAIEQYATCCQKLKQILDSEPEEQTKNLYARVNKQSKSSKHDVVYAEPVAQNNNNSVKRSIPECIGRESEMSVICSCIEHTYASKQGQCIFVSGRDGIGKSYFITQAIKFARQLDMAVAKTLFFDINCSCENGIRELFLNIAKPPLLAENFEIPVFIANQYFNNHPKYDLYLATLYSILGFQLPKRISGKYSALKPAARELLLKTVLVEIITAVTHQSPLLLILDDSQHMTTGMQFINHTLVNLTHTLPVILVSVTSLEPDTKIKHNDDIPVTSINMIPLSMTQLQLIFPDVPPMQNSDLLYFCWLRKLKNPDRTDYPTDLTDLLEQHISTLSDEDHYALNIATILGLRFSYEALRTLLDNPHYNPEHLLQQGYLQEWGNMLEFTHQITQQILYQLLDNNLRKNIHFKAASYYLFGNTHLHAYHLDAAGSTDTAKAYLSAALSADQDFNPNLAMHFFDKAMDCAQDNQEKYFSAIHKGDILLESGRIALAVQAYDHAQDFAADQHEQTLAWLNMAVGLIEGEQYPAARNLLERCEPILVKNSDHEIQAKLYYYLAITMSRLNLPDAAIRYNKIAFEHARQAENSYWQINVALLLGNIEFKQLHLNKAFSDLSYALQLEQEDNYIDLKIQILITLAKVKLFKADFKGSANDLEHVMNIAAMTENHQSVLEILCLLCLLDFYKGQFARLQQHTELATELCNLTGASDQKNHIASYQLLAAYHTGNQNLQHYITEIRNNIEPANIASFYVLAPIMALTVSDIDDAISYLIDAKNIISQLDGPQALECCFLSIEAAIHHQLWQTAMEIADKLILLINNEPLPFFIMCAERVRILSQVAQDNMTEITRTELVDIFASAKHFGLEIHLPAYQLALNQLRDPIQL